jgi:carbon storage regulator CsrA
MRFPKVMWPQPTKAAILRVERSRKMLVLTRRQGESIKIGEDIRITVLQSLGRKVRIGIEAPDNVKIVRNELGPEDNDGESD